MASWWEGTGSLRNTLSSGVESIKQATKDIAQELAEVEEEEFGGDVEELHYSSGPPSRLEQMFADLEKAYNAQKRELEELRAVHSINQRSSQTLSEDLNATQETNARLRQEHHAATLRIAELEERIEQNGQSSEGGPDRNGDDSHSMDSPQVVELQKRTKTMSAENAHLREQLSSAQEELHEFKKKTKSKWDGVKSRFQSQRQSAEALKKEVAEWKSKYEELSQYDDVNALRAEVERYQKALSVLKGESQEALDAVTRKCEAVEAALSRSDAKYQDLKVEKDRDLETMTLLSTQHQQCKVMVKEQDRELEALRDEIAKQRQCALDSLNLDEQTQIVVDELTANNERAQEQSANLRQQVDALQGRIGSMRSEFVQFQAMVSNRLLSDIRPSVVALQDEYAGLKRGYQEVASKYRQMEAEYGEYQKKANDVKRQYEVEMSSLKETAAQFEAACSRKERLRNETLSEHETLQSSNVVLKREVEDLEAQLRKNMDEFREMERQKEAKDEEVSRSLYAVLFKHGVVTQSDMNSEGQSATELPAISDLVQRLAEWMDSAAVEKAESEELEAQQISLIVKQCGVSRIVAVQLLAEHHGDAAAAIFAFTANSEAASTERSSLDRERTAFRERMEEIEGRRKRTAMELEETRSAAKALKLENVALASELKGQREKCESLEAQYISACNEVDEVTNAKNEVENECDRLHEAVEHHQSVLEEERLSTQEVIEAEQERADRAVAELKRLDDAHKLLEAQKADLVKQLHSKMKSEVISDHDRSSNLLSLRSEMDAVRDENERLKLTVNSMKELHKKSVSEKDGDIIELNTVINALKMENEELRALENEYIALKAAHRSQREQFAAKREAFNNLQIAFDALQAQSRKLKAAVPQNRMSIASNDNKSGNGGNAIRSDGGDEAEQRLKTEVAALTAKYQSTIKQLQEVRAKFTQSQKYQIRLEHETAQLRSTISKTAQKLKNMAHSDDQIDRRVIIKLLVTFFDRWYSGGDTREVIELISKILNFDENEKKKCRLQSASNSAVSGLWGFATSWITAADPMESQQTAPDPTKRSGSQDLGSLWVEFLLNELGDADNVAVDNDDSNFAHVERKEDDQDLLSSRDDENASKETANDDLSGHSGGS